MLKKIALSTFIALSLTACGSSGGSSSNHQTPDQPPSQPPSQPPLNGDGGNGGGGGGGSNPPPPADTVYGGQWWSSNSGDHAKGTVANNEDKIIVDGKDIKLAPGLSSKVVTELTYSQFGSYIDTTKKNADDGENTTYLYSYGQFTPVADIQKTGKASYRGTAHYGSEALGKVVTDAVAAFDVDFGERSVKGVITHAASNTNLTLPTAKIEGSSFKGEANNVGVYGNFYGPNAAEIGGTFYNNISANESGFTGAFGAKKQ
ncbi:hypothetical protein A4G20_07820 [Pasteurellaceae bacterium RH1A]|nr:hypothetical protein A4G20_07820 [Pasteurellaceae bacterium RH1A]